MQKKRCKIAMEGTFSPNFVGAVSKKHPKPQLCSFAFLMYRPKRPPALHGLGTYNMFTLCTPWSITQLTLSCSHHSNPTVNKQTWVETDLDKDKNSRVTLIVNWLLVLPPHRESPHTVLRRICAWGSYFHGNSKCLQWWGSAAPAACC